MRLLPSEQGVEIKRSLALLDGMEQGDRLHLDEPCNCGARIQHDNGGNYHEIITIAFDMGSYYVKYDTTCELVAAAEWDAITKEAAIDVVRERAKNGYDITVGDA